VSRMKQSTIDVFSSIADRIFSFFGGRNLSVFKFWWLQLLLSLSLSLSHMTPSSDYETICHSLGRTKSLLENINSEISDKLSLWEHKSRLLNNSVTKRYEPLVLEYLDGYIDDMCEFYLNNSDDICRIFQQAITQKQHQVDTSRADLLKRKQHIQQMQEQKEQEINTQRAKTLETLQRQRDSLENNLKLVETEVNSMQSELSNITASLNEAPQNDDDFEYLTNFRNSLVEQVDAKQRELQEWKEQSRLRQMQLSEYSSALKPQRCETNWEAERELVSKTNVRLREQIEKMHNVISKRFPSEEDDLRSLALAELQNEKVRCVHDFSNHVELIL